MEKKMEEEKKVSSMEKTSGKVEEGEEEAVLPGFRFHPTDEELVGFYLRRKVERKGKRIDIVKDIDIYKHDPWDLPKFSTFGDKEWYFFCLRGRKYRNSIRPNRVTGSGFWKATGIDRPIYSASDSDDCIGLKKSLVYYRGSAGKGTKTDWMMHEFRLPTEGKNNDVNPNSIPEAEVWTICRIFKRNVSYKRFPADWKNISNKQSPTDSGSKSCSIESDAKDEHNYFESSNIQGYEKKPVVNYSADKNRLYAGHWIPSPHPPMTNLQHGIPNLNGNDLPKEGNWDELGTIMEFLADPAGLVNGFRYAY